MTAPNKIGNTEAVTLELRLLGTFAIRSEGVWRAGPAPKKGGELIQYLGIYPRRVAVRDELAAAFWPGLDFESVGHRIHLAASGARVYLRKLFAGVDALQCVGNGYTWNPRIDVVSDAERFIQLTRQGTMESLRAAVALYGGDFLAGDTADWLQPTRVRIASARAHALESITSDLMARNQHAAALAFGLELVEAERGHEIGTRHVMRCFAALGQRTRAMEQFHRLKAYLAEQIGVDPTEETAQLALKLAAGVAA